MEQHGRVPADIGDLLEQTSGKIAACKRGLGAPARVLDVLREDVETLSTRSPTHSADSLSRKQRNIVHDLNIELMKYLQNIRSIITQLRQHYQFLTEIILQVSMDLPAFLEDIGLQHLDGNFSEVTTVQQLLNLNSIEGEMIPIQRRRLEREVGKIRARMESETGLSEIPPLLHQLQETTLNLTKSCLDKLNEFVSVTSGFKEEPGITWRAWIRESLSSMWNRSSNSEDTSTAIYKEVIAWIEQEQLDLSPTSAVDNVTSDLTEFVLKNDMQTLSSFKESIENIRSELSNVNSSVSEQYNQVMAMADSL
ncbi:PREDICTED: uncharacterized protein LOC109464598 [Branchiostoma belcheri]|uniref:Uncharacterized protein LOC109464598 n=1 Tax=Branchiostoma belcheri TaxID=7741 RepID=A0A6P4Y465_BRABE|nr:PREDICTED: uncharacterized protein LOC109464598 [Branchiostoma belcheri]